MSPRALNVSAAILATLGIIGLSVPTASRPAGWFCLFGAFALQVWNGLRSGVISSSLGFGGYWFTHRRDEAPVIFMWAVIVQSALAAGFFFAFLVSL